MLSDFRVGEWIVRPRRECIERGNEQVHIHPRPMQVLERLAAAAGEVVSRDELFASVWPGVVVTDDALTQCIVELRKAFGDSASKQKIIKTIPKVGFRLVPDVAELPSLEGGATLRWKPTLITTVVLVISMLVFLGFPMNVEEETLPSNSLQRASIVVLPFVNMSADEEQEYFSDGITEELINLLAQAPDLRVISRTSAFSFKDTRLGIDSIADRLGVSHVLEGSVRKSGDHIRITAHLIDAQDDNPLWSQTFERGIAEIFAVQDEIALRVVEKIEGSLLESRPLAPQTDPEVFRLYLLGQFHLNQYGYQKAMDHLLEAIALDPHYAPAHLAMASLYGGKTFFGDLEPRQGYARIRGQLAMALGADGEQVRIHRPVAEMQFYFDWNWTRAEESFTRAIEGVPSDAHAYQLYAWYLSAMGRFEEATAAIDRGLELEPLAPAIYLAASNVFYFSDMHEMSILRCKEALELSPNHPLALSQLGWSYFRLGMIDEAIDVMEESVRLSPWNTQHLWMLGHAYALAGYPVKARNVLSDMHELEVSRYVMPFGFAMIHAGLAEYQQALDWLENAYEERNGWMVYLAVEPRLDPLRSEPRFQALMERMNFPD